MRQKFETRTIVGGLIWIGLIAAAVVFSQKWIGRAPDATAQLASYAGKQRSTIEVDLPQSRLIRIGDPIYLSGSDRVSAIGFVSQVGSEDNTVRDLMYGKHLYLTFYGSAPELREGDLLKYHRAPDSAAWVLKTMFPPEKRAELSRVILNSYRRNQTQIVDALRPVVEASLKDASSVIREDLKAAFERREDEIREIGQRYQEDLVQEEIIPLIQDEIWPIVSEESRPLADQVGREIWSEVSMFRFGWRFLYDKTPLPERKLAEKEFKRFVDQKALPILESHIGDFVELQKVLLTKITANDEVKATMSDSFKTIIADEEVQGLLSEVFREVFVNNEKLQGVLEERWNQPEAQTALQLTNQRLDPTITEIGYTLFGSPDTKITPEFARVLRHRILHKDSRWLTLHQSNAEDARPLPPSQTLPIEYATQEEVIPYAPARDTK